MAIAKAHHGDWFTCSSSVERRWKCIPEHVGSLPSQRESLHRLLTLKNREVLQKRPVKFPLIIVDQYMCKWVKIRVTCSVRLLRAFLLARWAGRKWANCVHFIGQLFQKLQHILLQLSRLWVSLTSLTVLAPLHDPGHFVQVVPIKLAHIAWLWLSWCCFSSASTVHRLVSFKKKIV